MTKTIKLISISILIILSLFIGITVFVNMKIQQKVENFLQTRLPQNISQTHRNMDVDTFEGTITISDLLVHLKNKSDTITHTTIGMDKLIIEDVSYWKYLFKDEIHIEDIKFKSPIITYHKDKVIINKDSERIAPIKLFKPIIIEKLSIDNTTLTIFEKGKDSVLVHTSNTTIEIDDILISKETLLQKIPATFSEYKVTTDSIFVKISPYENVTAQNLTIKDQQVSLENIALKTKYSQKELSKIITEERDHIDLEIKNITLIDIDFGFIDNKKLFVKSSNISIEKPVASIYRDKLVSDDTTIKKLYSKMLRETSIDLTIDKIALNDGSLIYTERVKQDNTGGTIDFKNLSATILNASNTYTSNKKTFIDIEAIFMKNTPLKANWEFDTTNKNDQFIFKAEIGSLKASDLNTFMKPNLKVQLEGITNKTYFTISGTNNTSKIDMRMSYDNFKVNILNKNGNKKNKFLSAIANIFIKEDSKNNNQEFRDGSGVASRDKTKSFFNYLWLNIRSGLLNTLTGKSEN